MEQIDALRADMGIVMRFAEKIAMDDPEREAFDRIQSALPALLDAVEMLEALKAARDWRILRDAHENGDDYADESKNPCTRCPFRTDWCRISTERSCSCDDPVSCKEFILAAYRERGK